MVASYTKFSRVLLGEQPSLLPAKQATLWATSLVVFLSDQVTKSSVLLCTDLGSPVPLLPGYVQVLPVKNSGVAMGIFSQFPNYAAPGAMAAMLFIGLAAIVYIMYHYFLSNRLGQLGLALILGGALGNIFDRVRFGHVLDFLHVQAAGAYCPVFNLADLSVLAGISILVFCYPGR